MLKLLTAKNMNLQTDILEENREMSVYNLQKMSRIFRR